MTGALPNTAISDDGPTVVDPGIGKERLQGAGAFECPVLIGRQDPGDALCSRNASGTL